MTTIDLITGILGAGKTTFIRKYAANLLAQGKKIAILENDFGAVNVDRCFAADYAVAIASHKADNARIASLKE